MLPVMESEVVAACNAIGSEDKETKEFVLGEDCRLCLKDVQRWLRKDFEQMSKHTTEKDEKVDDIEKLQYRTQLENLNLVLSKLLPILKDYCVEDVQLFEQVLELLVHLTTPVLLLCNEKKPKTKEGNHIFLEMTMKLYDYKIAFGANLKCWSVLAKHIGRILALDWEHRFEEHKRMLQMIFILIRNLLHVPLAPNLETGTGDDCNPQDRLIEMMQDSGLLELLLYVLDSDDESDYYMYAIEIMSLMFRDQSAEFLAKSLKLEGGAKRLSNKRTDYEKSLDKQEFEELLKRDKSKNARLSKYNNRFKEATYQIKNVKSLGDNDVIVHKTPATNVLSLQSSKQSLRKAKNFQALVDDIFMQEENSGTTFHKSHPSVRRILGQFCEEFLQTYNKVFKHLRNELQRKRGQPNDETYFLWGFQFFCEYNRYSKLNLSLVAETFSQEVLHYVHTQIMEYLEKLKMQKKPHEYIPWSRRLLYAVKAYREFLFTMHFASSSDNYKDEYAAKDIKKKTFYEDDYRELMLIMLKDYNERKMTKGLLRSLVETNHVFLNMLQKYCLLNNVVLVKSKKRKATTTKKTNKKKKTKKVTEDTWTEVLTPLMEALEGRVKLPAAEEDEDVIPMDPAVDFEPDLQKMAIIKRLRKMLLDKRTAEAVALYRNAREAWSDDQELSFGTLDATVNEEADGLKQIYMSGIEIEVCEEPFVEEGENDENEQPPEGIIEETERTDSRLEFDEFVKKYCSIKVIHAYSLLLKKYDTNNDAINRCIVKMFHRIGVDCCMYAMFFQASILRVFQRILNEPKNSYKDLEKFATHIIRKLAATAAKNENLLIETLFWKKTVEAAMVDESKECVQDDETINH